jgi:hypothetical protein
MSDIVDVKERLKEDFVHYRRALCYMEANVPIQVLCLPKVIETALLNDGCIRVYDLINRDLGKIKGLGDRRLNLLTSRLDEFLSISL